MEMTIYRVEDAKGEGPYRGDGCLLEMANAHDGSTNHPSPYRDGIRDYNISWVCGFTSLEQLRCWFKGWEKALHENGFKISVYNEDDLWVTKGRKQCVFRRSMRIARWEWQDIGVRVD